MSKGKGRRRRTKLDYTKPMSDEQKEAQIVALADRFYRQYPRDIRLYYLNSGASTEEMLAGAKQAEEERDLPKFKANFYKDAKEIIERQIKYAAIDQKHKPYYDHIYRLLKSRASKEVADELSSRFYTSGDRYSTDRLLQLAETIASWPEKMDRTGVIVGLAKALSDVPSYLSKDMSREERLLYREVLEQEMQRDRQARAVAEQQVQQERQARAVAEQQAQQDRQQAQRDRQQAQQERQAREIAEQRAAERIRELEAQLAQQQSNSGVLVGANSFFESPMEVNSADSADGLISPEDEARKRPRVDYSSSSGE